MCEWLLLNAKWVLYGEFWNAIFPFCVDCCLSFFIDKTLQRVTRRVACKKREMLTLREYICWSPGFDGVRVAHLFLFGVLFVIVLCHVTSAVCVSLLSVPDCTFGFLKRLAQHATWWWWPWFYSATCSSHVLFGHNILSPCQPVFVRTPKWGVTDMTSGIRVTYPSVLLNLVYSVQCYIDHWLSLFIWSLYC